MVGDDDQGFEGHLKGGGAVDVQDWRAEAERSVGGSDKDAEMVPTDDGQGRDHDAMQVVEDHLSWDEGQEGIACSG